MKNKIKKVAIIGSGVLGSQISWQTAFKGYRVMVFDISEKSLETCRHMHQRYAALYKSLGHDQDKIELTFSRLKYTNDLKSALDQADLISESVPEHPDIKRACFEDVSRLVPPETILTTNSSTIIPGVIAGSVQHNERFLAMHFANLIWKNNICEVMGHANTSKEVTDQVVDFARSIGMVPIVIKKEQSGYVLNSMLIPFINAATDLYLNGIADYKDVDRTWMISSGMNMGPFGIVDLIGLETVYNIKMLVAQKTGSQDAAEKARMVKEQFISTGKIGIKSGEGFYAYPNPEYEAPDFLAVDSNI